MNKDRLWIIGGAAMMVVLALLGWSLGISPLLAQATDANAQVVSMTAANVAAQTKLGQLKQQFAQLDSLQANLDTLRASIPTEADISVFLREIGDLCSLYNVKLTNVLVNDAEVFQAPADPAAAAGTTPTPTPSPATDSTVTAQAPAVPGVAAGNFVLVPVKITVTGAFTDVMNFAGGIQSGPRLYLLSQLQTVEQSTGAGTANGYQGVLTGFAFVLHGAKSPVTTPTPTPMPTPTPGATGTPTPSPTGTAIATPSPSPTP